MTRIMMIVTAALLAGSLACGKEPAAAPAKSATGATGASGASGAVAAAPAVASTAAKPVNANCPIGGEPIAADGGTATFKGQTIGFCCPKCAPKFNAMDDAAKLAALEKNGTKLPQ
jgi:hypothetical protein